MCDCPSHTSRPSHGPPAPEVQERPIDYSDLNDPNAYLFFKCRGDEACRGPNRYKAECSAGYYGNLCAGCVDGYGTAGDLCIACPSTAVNVVLVIVFILVAAHRMA